MLKNKRIVLHPFLICIYPVIAMLAFNITEMRPTDALRALLVSLVLTTLLFLLLKVVIKDWVKAGLVCTLALLLFFSYGHIYDLLRNTNVFGYSIFRHRLQGIVWLAIFLLGTWWIIRRLKSPAILNSALNIVAIIALALPLFNLLSYQVQAANQTTEHSSLDFSQTANAEEQSLPDVYYILLDEYSRDDYLLQAFNYDNAPFLNALAERGFFIGYCSQSNYNQTRQSITSALNMNYIDAFYPNTYDNLDEVDLYKHGLANYLQHSLVRENFEQLGYSTVAFETGFDWTEIKDADLYLTRNDQAAGPNLLKGVNEFEVLMIRSSALLFVSALSPSLADLLLPDLNYPNRDHRERILFVLDSLEKMPTVPGPKFVFAHIVSPHGPFVFGPNGEVLENAPIYRIGYPDQISFLNGRVLQIIDELQKDSNTPPIIILQGDHGARQHVGEYGRLGILNAIYFPGEEYKQLYTKITPVNTFRTVFNQFFGQSYPLLDDISYKSMYTDPLNTIIIPNTRQDCEGK